MRIPREALLDHEKRVAEIHGKFIVDLSGDTSPIRCHTVLGGYCSELSNAQASLRSLTIELAAEESRRESEERRQCAMSHP